MKKATKFTVQLLTGATLTLLSTLALADDGARSTGANPPLYGDTADIPAHDPSVRRPQETTQTEVTVRQEASGPEIAPGAKRDALVPIPADNDGRIDPQ